MDMRAALASPLAAAILFIDRTGSVFNPSHNEMKIRYEGTSALPLIPPTELRQASAEYPQAIRDTYLQLADCARSAHARPRDANHLQILRMNTTRQPTSSST